MEGLKIEVPAEAIEQTIQESIGQVLIQRTPPNSKALYVL